MTDGTAPDIQVRHLLTHTAGFGYPTLLPGDPYRAAQVSTGLDQPGLTLEENLERIASVPLYFAPGSGWRYGVSTDVLGAVIEAIVGESLANAIADTSPTRWACGTPCSRSASLRGWLPVRRRHATSRPDD